MIGNRGASGEPSFSTANPVPDGLTSPHFAAFFISPHNSLSPWGFRFSSQSVDSLGSNRLRSGFIHNPTPSPHFLASLAKNSLTLCFQKSSWLTTTENLGSKISGRYRTRVTDHLSRPNWLTVALYENRDWMFSPEHGSGWHGTHHPSMPMPKLPKPAQMTPEERNREIAEIFARAFIRARFPNSAQTIPSERTQPQPIEMEPCKHP